MNISEALSYIHSTNRFGSKLGLHNMKLLLDRLGNPQKKCQFIHVAGTNGKGSTVAFLSNILAAAGYKTGMYTSPYIQRFNERIQVNGQHISDEAIAAYTAQVKAAVDAMVADGENHPTEFEIVTSLGFLYFAHEKCDVVVLEVGLGGRLDATNIIDCPLLAVITPLGLDHTEYLGNTIADIAFEKGGIIKEGGHVLSAPQPTNAIEVLQKLCQERNATCTIANYSQLAPLSHSLDGQSFSAPGYERLTIALLGPHQQENAYLAVLAVQLLREKGLNITQEALEAGLLNTRWPGRFEVVCKQPVTIIDGAHNQPGVETLCRGLATYFPGKKWCFVMGVLSDKDYAQMVQAVLPLAKRFITVTPNNPRALAAEDLAAYINNLCKEQQCLEPLATPFLQLKEALQEATQDPNALVCVFGSLYMQGDVRNCFHGLL